MKSFSVLISIFLISGYFGVGKAEFESALFSDDAGLETLMGQAFAYVIRNIYESGALPSQKNGIFEDVDGSMKPRAEIPLPLPDPLPIGDVALGESFQLGNAVIYGLSDSTVDVNLAYFNSSLLINLKIDAPELSSNGSYYANASLEAIGNQFVITGNGAYDITFFNFSIALDLQVKSDPETGNLAVSNVSLTIGYHGMDTFLENFVLNDEVYDWSDPLVQTNFAGLVRLVTTIAKDSINGLVEGLLNTVLQICSLTDLIGGDLSCLTGGNEGNTTELTTTPEDGGSGAMGQATLSVLSTLFFTLAMYLR